MSQVNQIHEVQETQATHEVQEAADVVQIEEAFDEPQVHEAPLILDPPIIREAPVESKEKKPVKSLKAAPPS